MAVMTNEELQDAVQMLSKRVDGISMLNIFKVTNQSNFPAEAEAIILRGMKNFPMIPSYETSQNSFEIQRSAWDILCAAVVAVDEDGTTMESLLDVSGFAVDSTFIEITFAQAFVIGTYLASKDEE
jgi:hypothetical protein